MALPRLVYCVVFVRGVVKARLKTRRLGARPPPGQPGSVPARNSLPARMELRSGGPAVKVTEKRRRGAAGQPGRRRSFPGCVRRALPSAWPPLLHREPPASVRALGSLRWTCPRFPRAERSDSRTAWILIANSNKNLRNAALCHYLLFKRGVLLGKEHVLFH